MSKITNTFRDAAMRKGLAPVSRSTKNAATKQVALAATVELLNLGFKVNPDDLEGVSATQLTQIISSARRIIGADRNMTPVYPGFPKQVQELSTLTLLVEQILHYWSFGTYVPDYPDVLREGLPIEDALRNARDLKIVKASDAAIEMINTLATQGIALSSSDRDLLSESLNIHALTVEELASIISKCKHGENMQTLIGAAISIGKLNANDVVVALAPLMKRTDFLLRLVLIAYASPSDVKWESNFNVAVNNLMDSNARSVRMGNISKPARRAIINALGNLTSGYYADALVKRQELWRIVMRAIHPYSLPSNVQSKRALDIIHSNIEYRTLNSSVEEAIKNGKIKKVVKLLSENNPGDLYNRAVALLRLDPSLKDVEVLSNALIENASKVSLTNLISTYNGVIAANDDHTRVTRVAGLNNTMVDRGEVKPINKDHQKILKKAMKSAMVKKLSLMDAPSAPVGVVSPEPVPLVRRDLSSTDRSMDRGSRFAVAGSGDVVRIFGHFKNNMRTSGYMDISAIALDASANVLGVCNWSSWNGTRSWGTYSGDTLVYPGKAAAEFVDVELKALPKNTAYVAMGIHSYSGFPINEVDFIAGAMLRSAPNSGEVFDPRSVITSFKPMTSSLHALPFIVDVNTKEMIWLDSSSGSTNSYASATWDNSATSVVYDELLRPRLTMGELTKLWAKAHGVETVKKAVDSKELMTLIA